MIRQTSILSLLLLIFASSSLASDIPTFFEIHKRNFEIAGEPLKLNELNRWYSGYCYINGYTADKKRYAVLASGEYDRNYWDNWKTHFSEGDSRHFDPETNEPIPMKGHRFDFFGTSNSYTTADFYERLKDFSKEEWETDIHLRVCNRLRQRTYGVTFVPTWRNLTLTQETETGLQITAVSTKKMGSRVLLEMEARRFENVIMIYSIDRNDLEHICTFDTELREDLAPAPSELPENFCKLKYDYKDHR